MVIQYELLEHIRTIMSYLRASKCHSAQGFSENRPRHAVSTAMARVTRALALLVPWGMRYQPGIRVSAHCTKRIHKVRNYLNI